MSNNATKSDFLKNTDYDTKIDEIENKIHNCDKYITTPEFDNLTAKIFTARLKQAQLVTKDDIDDFVKKTKN